VLAHQGLCVLVLSVHIFELAQALLEFFAGRGVLCNSCNQLHIVQASLLVKVEEQLNDLVQLVQVVDLNFALLQLGQGGERSNS
jgi:hypothetical protein